MKEYQSVPIPEDLIETINESNSYDNKIQVINFNSNHSIAQDDHYNNHYEDGHIHINDMIISVDESYDELNNLQQPNGMESNKIVDQGYKILLPVGPSKSTSISVKHNGTKNTRTFLQGLFPIYLHKAVITVLCLQLSLTVYMHKDIPCHLYKGISTVVHLLLSLPVSLRNGIL